MAKRDGFWRWDRAKLAEEKGRQAYMDGKPQEANPYKRTFWGFGGYWDLGWMLAEADAKCEENMNTQNTQNVEMLQQINQFLAAMSPPDPDGMYSVAKVDSSVDPVELYRQGLAMGSGHVWYVGTKKVATAITGNGPRAKANAEFYAAAPEPMHFQALIGVSDEFARRVVQEDVRRASCRLADDWRGYVTAYIQFEWDADPESNCLCADFVEVLSTTPRRDGTAGDDTPMEF